MFGKFILGAIVGATAVILYAEKKGLEVAFKLKEDLGKTVENVLNLDVQR